MPTSSDSSPLGLTHRRSLVRAAVGGAVAVGALGGLVRLTQGGDQGEDDPSGSLTLSADDGSDVAFLSVPLEARLVRGRDGLHQSAELSTSTYSMAAITWRAAEAAPSVSVRARRDGTWTAWTRLPQIEDRPAEAQGRDVREGTAAWWAGPSRSIQVRVRGDLPDDLSLVLLHPAARDSDDEAGWGTPETPEVLGRRSGDALAPQPDIVTRRQWGADESWRNGSPSYDTTINQVHVHHTASGNTYARADVPALLRGFYRYHTQSLGWSDIGYNFLVDKYGRTFEGRAGGVARPVRGAHTLGFNTDSTGVSVIGNYELVAPTEAIIDAVAAVAAWKLDAYGRQPRGTTTVRSSGSDKYAAGALVKLRVIDGHRDTNGTACPGGRLYERLPDIRTRAHAIAATGATTEPPPPTPVGLVTAAVVTGSAVVGRRLRAWRGTYDPATATAALQWLRDGAPIEGETRPRHRCTEADVGSELAVRVTTTAEGRTPLVELVPAGPVRAPATLAVEAVRTGRGRLRVMIQLQPPSGVAVLPSGEVTVRIGRRRAVVPVADLDSPVVLGRRAPLAPSTRLLRVTYPGDASFTGTETTLQV